VARIDAPARLDGGDVLVAGETIFVGRSERTDARGVEALAAHAEPRGHRVVPVPVGVGLHFKSSVNLVAPGVLLVTRPWVDRPELAGFEILVVPGDEANALRVNDTVLVAAGHPGTAEILRDRGLRVEAVPMSESMKMDGGLTCLSLRLCHSAAFCRVLPRSHAPAT
jgi:dimethylargininase